MRIEQLVQHRPGDDDRVRFGPGVTVFAGLGPQERVNLIETLVDALTGRLPNASIVYSNHERRKVFADHTGATYADNGSPAPAPNDLLGRDPIDVSTLLTVTADDLGLGPQESPGELRAELTDARTDLERLQAECARLDEQAGLLTAWAAEVADLEGRLERADEDAARWAWTQLKLHLDEVRAELEAVDRVHDSQADRRILEAVDALRSTGEVWADLAAAASELRDELGDLPDITAEDLARVASTPASLPAGLDAKLEAWQAAVDLRRGAEAELAQATDVPPEPDDPLVASFAAVDQVRLWKTHRDLVEATESYEKIADTISEGELDPETEERIEEAHLDVVRRQRDAERRFRPGVLGSALFAIGALMAGNAISVLLGVALLGASISLGVWLIVMPRRVLSAARMVEEQALAHADATSWLGLHLRRLDSVTDLGERKRFERAANARAAAQVEWDEVAGSRTTAELTARADVVREHADAVNPQSIARRREEAEAFRAAAGVAEEAAATAVRNGLQAYGPLVGGGRDLNPQQLLTLIEGRVRAGEVARRAKKLAVLEQREAEAGRRLGDVLSHLGYETGDLESRLEGAIAAVTAAQRRQHAGGRSRTDVVEEIAQLEAQVQADARPGWSDEAHPTGPPTDPQQLANRLSELTEQIASAGKPDLIQAGQCRDEAAEVVTNLEARLEELAKGPTSLQSRLISQLGRTTHAADHEEPVPIIVDEALVSIPVAERMDLLDLIVKLAERVQVIVLTEDPVVARWARDRAARAKVTLFEADLEPEPLDLLSDLGLAPAPVPLSAQVSAHHAMPASPLVPTGDLSLARSPLSASIF